MGITLKCVNEKCSFEKDGVCAEGVGIEECTNVIDFSEIELIKPDDDVENTQSEKIELHPNKKKLIGQSPLTLEQAESKLKSQLGKVISFVGPIGVGKTTLISSLYDMFNTCNELPVRFGGSDTLYAFERLCHHSRITSKSTQTNTPRTSVSEGVSFYHLAVKDENDKKIELLLADRAGEDYTQIVNNIKAEVTCEEIKRSDIVFFLADASLLGSLETRHQTRRSTIKLIKAIFEKGALGRNTKICLLLTKNDLITGQDAQELLKNEANKIKNEVNNLLYSELTILPVAARPSTAATSELRCFKSLLEHVTSSNLFVEKKPIEMFKSERSFHNLELKYD